MSEGDTKLDEITNAEETGHVELILHLWNDLGRICEKDLTPERMLLRRLLKAASVNLFKRMLNSLGCFNLKCYLKSTVGPKTQSGPSNSDFMGVGWGATTTICNRRVSAAYQKR